MGGRNTANSMTQDEQIRELLSAYLDDTLTADERRHAEAYLRLPQWRQYYEELLLVRESVRSLPSYEPSRDVADVICERLANATAPVPWHGKRRTKGGRGLSVGWWRWSQRLAAVASILAVAVLTWYTWRAAERVQRRPGDGSPVGDVHSPLAQQSPTSPSPSPSSPTGVVVRSAREAAHDKDLAAHQPPPAIRDSRRDKAARTEPPHSSPPGQDAVAGRALPPAPTPRPGGDEVVPVLALVIDVVLTDKGVEEQAVERSLHAAGIPLGQAIPVDTSLEKVILAHRVFGAIGPEELPDPSVMQPGRRPFLQLMFLVATGRQYDLLLQNLYDLRATGDVALLRLDLATGSSDTTLFAALDRVSRAVSVDDQQSHAVAHPFLLDDQMRGRLSDALAAAQKKLAVAQPTPAVPPSESELDITPAKPEDFKDMESWLFKVLLVARSDAQLRRAP